MGASKKLAKPVYITTILDKSQQEALRLMAYKKSKSMSELIREALTHYLHQEPMSAKENLLSLRGLGKGVWKEEAQSYVNKLRQEWDG